MAQCQLRLLIDLHTYSIQLFAHAACMDFVMLNSVQHTTAFVMLWSDFDTFAGFRNIALVELLSLDEKQIHMKFDVMQEGLNAKFLLMNLPLRTTSNQ